MLERHEDDPDGYDLLFVDPIKRGNYGSRFSHSCEPNTQTVPMAVDGQYVIGIFARRKIEYGQELTFDYNSVTESEQEYRSAICLCAQLKCRGTYLSFAGSTTYHDIIGLYHNNLHRAALIFRACCPEMDGAVQDTAESLSDEGAMESTLRRRHIARSMLSGLPLWGKRFCLLITDFIEFERREFPQELRRKYGDNVRFEDIENEVCGVKEQRKQNLAVTVDKIKYVLRNQSSARKRVQPPIRALTPREVLHRLWNDENSLINVLLRCLRFHVHGDGDEEWMATNAEMVDNIERLIVRRGQIGEAEYGVMREHMLQIRDWLRQCVPTESCYFHAAADLMHLWANTK